MADDIDIEEHDVLENPVIRNIFPDINVIKKEISQYYDDVPNIKQEPETATASATEKILVGEEASCESQAIKLSVDKPEINYNNLKPFEGTKIILGTKPNKAVKKIQDADTETTKEPNISLKSVVRIPKLKIQDLGEYIYESKRYCKDCKTLFPSKSDFLEHKQKSHSIKNQNKPTAVKSTPLRYPGDKNNRCNECESRFNFKSSLIRHYKHVHKKIITVKKNYCDKNYCDKNTSCVMPTDDQCDLMKSNRNESAVKTRKKDLNIKVTLEESKTDKKKVTKFDSKQTKQNVKVNKSECTICGSYFANKANLQRHYRNIHRKNISTKIKPEKIKNTTFDNKQTKQKVQLNKGKCTICDSNFANIASLQRHYRNIHRKNISSKIKDEIGSSDHANYSSHIASINKLTRPGNINLNPDSQHVCFHCNKNFFDQASLIEHIYTILEPNQYPKRKDNKILTPVKALYKPTNKTKNRELAIEKAGSIRLKDKLIFENQDSDGSNGSLSETEEIRNEYFEGQSNSNGEHSESTNLDKEQTKNITDFMDSNVSYTNESKESQSLDGSSSLIQKLQLETKTNKRKQDLSDDDANSEEWTVDSEEKNSPHDAKSLKKQKLDTADTNTSNSTSKNNSKEVKLDTSDENRKLKMKRSRSYRFTPISKNDIRNKSTENTFVYECEYCSYIALTSRAYCMHMFGKHKREKVSKVNRVIFDIQCKFCPTRTSKRFHNRHLQIRHFDLLNKPHYEKKESRKKEVTSLIPAFKKVQSFVLKSIVFKCTKCDIHFLSSSIAKDHEKHMELLINWKCSICRKIFKKKDELLHLQQHDFSSTVTVYQFEQSELSRLLYNCTKCAIHFTEERYLKHYSKCGFETTDSVYCKNCDILVDKYGYVDHEAYHKTENNPTDIIVITGDLVTNNQDEANSEGNGNTLNDLNSSSESKYLNISNIPKESNSKHESKCQEPLKKQVGSNSKKESNHNDEFNSQEEVNSQKKLSRQEKINCQEKLNSQEELNNQEELNSQEKLNNLKESSCRKTNETEVSKDLYNPMNCLTFCHTCKCYLSDIAVNRKSHVEGRCFNMVKYTCPKCGLVFTNKTINTHRVHHKKVKGLNMQDFEFFDLNGIQIRPPIPEYPSCSNCEVIFVGRNAVLGHICSETEYLTCEVCNIKLSENAFKLHMNFHDYRMPNEIVSQPLHLDPREPQPKDNGLAKHAVALNQSNEAMLQTGKLPSVVIVKSQEHIKLDKKTASSELTLSDVDVKESSNSPTIIELETNPNLITATARENKGSDKYNAKNMIILYTCQCCKTSVDTYDKVIQHCQNHFSANATISSSLKICSKCSLKFENDTFESHQKLHMSCDTIQVLAYDPTYFTADNDTWIRHVFASVSPSVQKEAIQNSIYKHECRIKMEVVQQGPSHLTLYKCHKCGIFIDHDCMISHIRDGCSKSTGKYPCSVCGLPFISYLSRISHEKIHRRYDNVRVKSYNIVLINCETHNSYNFNILNAIKQYILYQCRSCDGIVDKFKRYNHICDVDDLQKCPICELLFYRDDFDKHTSRHSDLAMYNTANMKVVLFGNKDQSILKKISPNFKGVISNYELYKCTKCQNCENNKTLTLRHVCTLDDSKWKCPKCSNYISARSIKRHIKLHDTDPDYMTDNLSVVSFGSDIDKKSSEESVQDKSCDNNDSTLSGTKKPESGDKTHLHAVIGLQKDTEKQSDHSINNNIQNSAKTNKPTESVVLFKCCCGLHYIDEISAKNHAKQCCPKMKIIRQNCSKCNLKFNPKELFSHILAHHSDKNKTFSYNVIEIQRCKT